MNPANPFILVSGNANIPLSNKIAELLNVTQVDPQIVRFANGEIYCEIASTVRGADVFVVQSVCTPANDNLMELLIMIDALKRASANSISVVMPHYGYARQDRKAQPRSPITAKLIADLLTVAGASRVITVDLHAGQIQGFFDIPFDNIYASPVLVKYVIENLKNDNTMCISPDSGGVERVREYSRILGCDMGMIDKRRTGKNIAKAMNIIGDVRGKECIIVDDMVDTAGTLVEACTALKRAGATKVFAAATHPVLSNPALERISKCDDLEQLIVTDTIPLTSEALKISKIKVLSIADLMAKAIHRAHKNESLSTLFI